MGVGAQFDVDRQMQKRRESDEAFGKYMDGGSEGVCVHAHASERGRIFPPSLRRERERGGR